MILEQENKKVIILKENKTLGMILVYSRIIKGKPSKNEGFITNDELVRFVAKHQLDNNMTCNQIGRVMINYYNSTLRIHDLKRKFITVYIKKEGIYYIKE